MEIFIEILNFEALLLDLTKIVFNFKLFVTFKIVKVIDFLVIND